MAYVYVPYFPLGVTQFWCGRVVLETEPRRRADGMRVGAGFYVTPLEEMDDGGATVRVTQTYQRADPWWVAKRAAVMSTRRLGTEHLGKLRAQLDAIRRAEETCAWLAPIGGVDAEYAEARKRADNACVAPPPQSDVKMAADGEPAPKPAEPEAEQRVAPPRLAFLNGPRRARRCTQRGFQRSDDVFARVPRSEYDKIWEEFEAAEEGGGGSKRKPKSAEPEVEAAEPEAEVAEPEAKAAAAEPQPTKPEAATDQDAPTPCISGDDYELPTAPLTLVRHEDDDRGGRVVTEPAVAHTAGATSHKPKPIIGSVWTSASVVPLASVAPDLEEDLRLVSAQFPRVTWPVPRLMLQHLSPLRYSGKRKRPEEILWEMRNGS
jgi:hypothetical protein